MSSKITRDIDLLHPFAKERTEAVLKACKEAGLNVGLFETLRTLTRQKWLKANGNSTTLNSYHRLGLAVDIVFLTSGGNWTWERPKSDWDKLADIFEANGFTAGWRWKSFKDGPHGQLDFTGMKSTDLYAKLRKFSPTEEALTPEFNNYIWSLIKEDLKYKRFLPQEEKQSEPQQESEKLLEGGLKDTEKQVDLPIKISYTKDEPTSWIQVLIKIITSLLGK